MSVITLPFIQDYPTPFGEDACDQYPSSLPQYFIEHYSARGDTIFDPFMGFGTTAFVSEAMERIPFGIEADDERFEWTAGQLTHWQNIKHGDAADMAAFDFPQMDLCVTSPPWMHAHERWNPLSGEENGYDAYLDDTVRIFQAVKHVMKPGASIVIHLSDLSHAEGSTPLVQNMVQALSPIIVLDEVMDVTINEAPEGASSCSCLVFKSA